MAENLNYKVTYSYCYSESVANCEKYGRLYTWSAAKEACPEGWHLPTNAEFETLLKAVGGSSVAGTMLKSKKGWYDGGHGIDEYGFTVLPWAAATALVPSATRARTRFSGVLQSTTMRAALTA